MIYNVVLGSATQQSESVIHIHMSRKPSLIELETFLIKSVMFLDTSIVYS